MYGIGGAGHGAPAEFNRAHEQGLISMTCRDGSKAVFVQRAAKPPNKDRVPMCTREQAVLTRQAVACSSDEPSAALLAGGSRGGLALVEGPEVWSNGNGLGRHDNYRVVGVVLSPGPVGDQIKAGSSERPSVQIAGVATVVKGSDLAFVSGDRVLVLPPDVRNPYTGDGFAKGQYPMRLVPWRSGSAHEVFGEIADQVAEAMAAALTNGTTRYNAAINPSGFQPPQGTGDWTFSRVIRANRIVPGALFDQTAAVQAVKEIADSQIVPAAAAYAWYCHSLYDRNEDTKGWADALVTNAREVHHASDIPSAVAAEYEQISGSNKRRRPDAAFIPSQRRRLNKPTKAAFDGTAVTDIAGHGVAVALSTDFDDFVRSRMLGTVTVDSPGSSTMVNVLVGRY